MPQHDHLTSKHYNNRYLGYIRKKSHDTHENRLLTTLHNSRTRYPHCFVIHCRCPSNFVPHTELKWKKNQYWKYNCNVAKLSLASQRYEHFSVAQVPTCIFLFLKFATGCTLCQQGPVASLYFILSSSLLFWLHIIPTKVFLREIGWS